MNENPGTNPDTQTAAQRKVFPSARYHAEVSRLVDFLSKGSVGTLASYADLAALVGFNVQEGTGYVISKRARRILQRDHGQLWWPDRKGKGLLRLNDEQSVETGEADLKAIRRKAKRSRRKIIDVVDYAA